MISLKYFLPPSFHPSSWRKIAVTLSCAWQCNMPHILRVFVDRSFIWEVATVWVKILLSSYSHQQVLVLMSWFQQIPWYSMLIPSCNLMISHASSPKTYVQNMADWTIFHLFRMIPVGSQLWMTSPFPIASTFFHQRFASSLVAAISSWNQRVDSCLAANYPRIVVLG